MSTIFSLRERQVLLGICAGLHFPAIGQILGISKVNVGNVVQSVCNKSGLSGRFELAMQMNAAVREKLYGGSLTFSPLPGITPNATRAWSPPGGGDGPLRRSFPPHILRIAAASVGQLGRI